jgi:hypothetical protein
MATTRRRATSEAAGQYCAANVPTYSAPRMGFESELLSCVRKPIFRSSLNRTSRFRGEQEAARSALLPTRCTFRVVHVCTVVLGNTIRPVPLQGDVEYMATHLL